VGLGIKIVMQPVAEFHQIMVCYVLPCRGSVNSMQFGNPLVFIHREQVQMDISVEKEKEVLTVGYI